MYIILVSKRIQKIFLCLNEVNLEILDMDNTLETIFLSTHIILNEFKTTNVLHVLFFFQRKNNNEYCENKWT